MWAYERCGAAEKTNQTKILHLTLEPRYDSRSPTLLSPLTLGHVA